MQLTADIQALAAELEGNPLAIYRWVHDHIHFVPTYGSIQGSQLTLRSRRGNAFDIAALLMALLRASGIPARQVVGTIEVPVDRITHWLAGVESPQVVQQLLGQGGIPNAGVLTGDELTHIRLEHTWVQAWVDYIPGRGAGGSGGAGDTWVPMDASFKRHRLVPPSGLFEDLPFDLGDLEARLLAQAQVDPALGKVAGIDEALILTSLDTYGEAAGEYFAARGLPPTPEALLGGWDILPETLPILPAGLPYTVVAESPAVATLPPALRLGITVKGFASALDRSQGNASFSHSLSLPDLNSRRLGLTWEPASEEDARILQDARDQGADSLPLYLIQVRPVLTLDGEAVATGTAVGMGQVQLFDVTLHAPGDVTTTAFQALAGDEMVFGVNGGGVTPEVVQARAEQVPTGTAAENLHQTALHFWMQADYLAQLAARSLGVHTSRRPSVGLFSSPLTVSHLFGAPWQGSYSSRFMDVRRSIFAVAGEEPARVRAFVRAVGQASSFLEGLVFDQLFSLDHYARAFSAMELLGDANRRGIPLYHISQGNLAAVLPLLEVGEAVKTDIAHAVARGRTVLVPERELDRGAWSGVGYIVEDPETGAAAYLISGGLAGGGWLDCLFQLEPLVQLIVIILVATILTLLILAIIHSLGTLAPVLGPAVATIVLLIAMLAGTAPAYAGGGFRKGGQADPCNCPPPPPTPPCEFHGSDSKPHHPCTPEEGHWHYWVFSQGPAPECRNRLRRLFGGCGPIPDPCPPC